MDTVPVELGQRSYPIYIGGNLFSPAGRLLRQHLEPGRVMVITNATVGRLYVDALIEGLRQGGFEPCPTEVPDGEEFKTLEWAGRLYDALLDQAIDRGSAIVALGGGVIGDLAGFVAATYKRGIALVQMPTTLLAQVDASIGGKTAVDHPRGKNLIGAFYQPRCVLVSLNVLETLPRRETRAGLAEVIKYGIIADEDLFAYLEENLEALLGGKPEALSHVVKRSCQIKARVVSEDERETGRREVLNFGHTMGHAIEAVGSYRRYRHGEAVAIGMVLAARLAVKLEMTSDVVLNRISGLLQRAGLSTEGGTTNPDEVMKYLHHDKKIRHGRFRFVLPERIGQVVITDRVSEELIREVLKEQKT